MANTYWSVRSVGIYVYCQNSNGLLTKFEQPILNDLETLRLTREMNIQEMSVAMRSLTQ